MTERQLSPCEELRSLVTEYIEKVMGDEEIGWFESHLGSCGSCEMHLHEMKAFVATLGAIGPEPVDVATREQLRGLFDSWRGERAGR